MRLRKDFPRFGRSTTAVGLTLDVFNTFNHNNFGTNYRTDVVRTDAGFGKPTGVATDARRFQVGAELNF
jgi:hypothetical protein